jgi:CDP-diacylglycerol---serine O-phosphatidyltransferase
MHLKKNIPNVITLSNLFVGSIALAMAFEGRLVDSALLVLLCMILDFGDGMAARLLHAVSPIGKQLDSLADLVSFGMVPSAIMYTYLTNSIATTPDNATSYIPYVAFLLAVFSALRLANFNIDTRQTSSFIGLPTPANALFFASIPLALHFLPQTAAITRGMTYIISNTPILITLICIFSYMMVAPLPMFSLKFNTFDAKQNLIRYVFLGLSLVLLIMLQWGALPVIIVLYIGISALDFLINHRRITN